ncbi:PD40 domain-containing protein [Nonomuraea sp. NEAU-A123]|uniref:PD40 domain-containing protein n=1 Tax=Nonomuraea sp. NEAU-A123 TaxID=2839649 RepID=UPI001BE465FA|nr:PD40 domain-containing protein [Nonomuraea sp. NEAU-A123]MBT2231779.1 PD40 domain-containing protein [Nonomuraea sp. NEAU-A123]
MSVLVLTTATATATASAAVPIPQPTRGPLPGATERTGNGQAAVIADLNGRPIQLTSYGILDVHPQGDPFALWAWQPGRRRFIKTNGEVAVSPDGRWSVAHPGSPREPGKERLRILDRTTGKSRDVAIDLTEYTPASTENGGTQYPQMRWPKWSPDGQKLLFTVSLARQGDRSAGVLILGLPDFTPRFIKIHKALVTVGGFEWNHDGTRFLVRHGRLGGTTVRLYDLQGKATREYQVRGRPGGDGRGVFSPSGKRFVTACLPLEKAACVWDAVTGKAVTRLPIAPSGRPTTLGWYDEKHLLISTAAGIGIVDLKGRVTETLLKLGKKTQIYPHFSALK